MDEAQVTAWLTGMLDCGVLCDPLLANHFALASDASVCDTARQDAALLAARHAPADGTPAVLGTVPFAPSLFPRAVFSALIATAVHLAREQAGRLARNHDMLRTMLHTACGKVAAFLSRYGGEPLYFIYLLVAGYDMMQPLCRHRQLEEAEWLQGIRHHPYPPEELETLLLIALAIGAIRLKPAAGRGGRVVQVTQAGMRACRWLTGMLENSGYQAARAAYAYLYHFDHVIDWDDMCREVWPDAVSVRSRFVEWIGVSAGARVLELGCGTATMAWEAGLSAAVGPHGRLVCLDESASALERAARKQAPCPGGASVTFLHGRYDDLPFADASFDVVLGAGFLHERNGQAVVREMARTAVPGGVIAVLQGLQTHLLRPFFREWFAPLFDLAGIRCPTAFQQIAPTEADILAWFAGAGLTCIEVARVESRWVFNQPDVVVQHIIRGFAFFQTALMGLPWDDRRTILHELVDRGVDVCRRYPLAERTVYVPMLMVRAARPGARPPRADAGERRVVV
ncbi:class I SAM-dependent methyltransferase [Alicyclobacillus cellulosilyticus]|uniref:class I SAM-dependent methyltransferase n=1 Tax=Alicyclobacillus cellulosilyticus TaxID=1003997 RepID=UPI00166BB9B0|nr:methyltransferase domain-containing protein [Alicyclobacillus cellulosilyticus]